MPNRFLHGHLGSARIIAPLGNEIAEDHQRNTSMNAWNNKPPINSLPTEMPPADTAKDNHVMLGGIRSPWHALVMVTSTE